MLDDFGIEADLDARARGTEVLTGSQRGTVLGFQTLNWLVMPASSRWKRELGSSAILAMMSGATVGVDNVVLVPVEILAALSGCVPPSAEHAAGKVITPPPAEPPMY